MWRLACLPFLAHSLGMVVDEFRFHRRRELPRWERWGHPLDTLSVLACYAIALLPARPAHLPAFIAASAFSSLFVTKDEWIHARRCGGGEMWLHAFLFVMHPVLLALVGYHVYFASPDADAWEAGYGFFRAFLNGQAVLTIAFMCYQILYWNGPWAKAALSPK